MAGQSIERREILRILTLAAGAATFPGFSKWSFACGHISNVLAQIKPGAREAGVSEFIDLMVSRDPNLQPDFRPGLSWLNSHSENNSGKAFLSLNPAQQVTLLESLAYKKKFRPGEERGGKFFGRIREYTVMGFYTSEIGLKELDFPGLKFYAESPACPHQDDPEHRHLAPAPPKS